jgi:hypothetical protein
VTSSRKRWLTVGLAALASAAGFAGLVRPLFGTALPMVHITWRDGIEPEREALERTLQLSEGAQRADGDWTYVPLDTSRETLRAIAMHPAVEQTDGIDRERFEIASRGPLTARRGGRFAGAPRIMGRLLKLAAYLFALAGVLALAGGLGLLDRLAPRAADAWQAARTNPRTAVASASRTCARWLERGVPVATPQAAGVFRLVFGTLVLGYVLANPVDAGNLRAYELGGARGLYGVVMRWLGEHAPVVDSLAAALAACGVLFVAGIFTRWSYALFVAALLVWGCVSTLQGTHHTVAALQLAMLALLAARWGDGWSVDAWLARRRGRVASIAGRQYGYAMWVPVLVLGVTFAAAAWSKVRHGPAWVLNGTVKYHFVSDLDDALVSWGPQLTQYAWVAVALSAGAVLIEGSAIAAAFKSSTRLRMTIGAGVLALLVGFKLFQGIVWPGWWLLLLGFLPWERVTRASSAAPQVVGSLSTPQTFAIAAVLVQQIHCSIFEVEARPLFSSYDMYSATYATRQDYEEKSNLMYRVMLVTDRGESEVEGCQMDDRAASLFAAAARGGAAEQERMTALLGPCLAEQAGSAPVVKLEGDRRVYDWERGRFEWKRGIDVIGPVRVDWLER